MKYKLAAKDIALSPFCYVELQRFVMDKHVCIVIKHLMDKQQQLFDKQGLLLDNKHYLATSGM